MPTLNNKIILLNLIFLILFLLFFFLLNYSNLFSIQILFIVSLFIFITIFYLINWNILKQYTSDLEKNYLINDDELIELINTNIKKLIFPVYLSDQNYEMVAKNKTASLLGGDLYNYLIDDQNNYWFAIGDASGHDLNSHLFSMMILTQMNYLIKPSRTPRDISKKINQHLQERLKVYPDIDRNAYASLAIIKADRNGNCQHYGQHPNFILCKKNSKDLNIIETDGDFIGLSLDHRKNKLTDKSFTLESGDILFTFTDGLFEQKNKENKYFGYRLYDFIKQYPKDDLKLFAEKLFEEVYQFSDKNVDDDITLMIIKKK